MKTGVLLACCVNKTLAKNTSAKENLPAVQVKLGRALRELRKAHDERYSQEGFALEAEINRGYYGSIERGEVNVSLLTLEKICATLGVTMEKLFGRAKL